MSRVHCTLNARVCCIAAVVLHLVDYYNIIIAVRIQIINIHDTAAGQTHIVHYTE